MLIIVVFFNFHVLPLLLYLLKATICQSQYFFFIVIVILVIFFVLFLFWSSPSSSSSYSHSSSPSSSFTILLLFFFFCVFFINIAYFISSSPFYFPVYTYFLFLIPHHHPDICNFLQCLLLHLRSHLHSYHHHSSSFIDHFFCSSSLCGFFIPLPSSSFPSFFPFSSLLQASYKATTCLHSATYHD